MTPETRYTIVTGGDQDNLYATSLDLLLAVNYYNEYCGLDRDKNVALIEWRPRVIKEREVE